MLTQWTSVYNWKIEFNNNNLSKFPINFMWEFFCRSLIELHSLVFGCTQRVVINIQINTNIDINDNTNCDNQ